MNLFLLTAVATQPMPVTLAILMVALGIGYISLITLLQRRFLTNPARIAELQLKINAVSAEVRQHLKNGNKELAMAKQKEIMPHMKESTKMQMKSMFVVMPLSLIVYFVLLPTAFAGSTAYVINFIVPMGYLAIFFWSALIAGVIMSGVLMSRDRKRAKERMALTTGAVKV